MHTFWGLALPNLAEHLAGRAPAPRADFGRGRSREIRAELDIAAPAERVFASLVDPDQVARWFGWRPEIDPRPGGRISFGLDGEITEFEPGERLVYGDGEGAVVRWELAGSAGGTHLTFVQSGSGAGELDSAAQHEAGWLGGLAELRRMHELGAGWAPVTTDLPTAETPDGGRPSWLPGDSPGRTGPGRQGAGGGSASVALIARSQNSADQGAGTADQLVRALALLPRPARPARPGPPLRRHPLEFSCTVVTALHDVGSPPGTATPSPCSTTESSGPPAQVLTPG